MYIIPLSSRPHTPNLPQLNDEVLCRSRRYSIVEENLTTSFEHCNAEPSPRELQIRALNQAMSMLSSHAQESRERLERLRVVLADRQAEPEVYKKLQRERWMEEKRRMVVDQETKILLRCLEVLDESSNDVTHIPCIPGPLAPESAAEARKDANLLRFLASTRSLVPIHTHRPFSTSFESPLKRKTIDRITPMRLRGSFPALKLSIDTRSSHDHSVSSARQSQPNSSDSGPTVAMPHLHDHSTPGVDPLSLSESATTDTSFSLVSLPETPVSTPLTTVTTDTCHILESLSLDPIEEQGGTATIFRTSFPHQFDRIPADLHITLPDYALELISHFDQSQMVALKPVFPTSTSSHVSLLSSLHSSVSPQRSTHTTSSLLQLPPSMPPQSPKSSDVRRRPSYRNLFSTSQAHFSDRVQGRPGSGPSGGGFFGRPRQPVALSAKPSSASLGPSATDNVTKKIKKRLSVLWKQ